MIVLISCSLLYLACMNQINWFYKYWCSWNEPVFITCLFHFHHLCLSVVQGSCRSTSKCRERSCSKCLQIWSGMELHTIKQSTADAERFCSMYVHCPTSLFRKLVSSEGSFKVLCLAWLSRPPDMCAHVWKVTAFLRGGLIRLHEWCWAENIWSWFWPLTWENNVRLASLDSAHFSGWSVATVGSCSNLLAHWAGIEWKTCCDWS